MSPAQAGRSIRVLHVITNLEQGGAQEALLRLIQGLDPARFPAAVLSLGAPGSVAPRIRAAGSTVEELDLSRVLPSPFGLARLVRKVRAFRPDIVQGWMYHANLLGGLAARITPGTVSLWNLRQSDPAFSGSGRSTRAVARLGARLSHTLPRTVVCCAESVRRAHVAMGYASERMCVIENGVDTDTYRPDPAAAATVRDELGIGPEVPLVGMIGRFTPQKDHAGFLEMARRVRREYASTRFVLAGTDVLPSNPVLANGIARAGLQDAVTLLGRREDVPALLAALDVAVLSSTTEGFPNTVVEAMACGVPCAVTDVGDARRIVGDTSPVVPASDPDALGRAVSGLLREPPQRRRRRGELARSRVVAMFSLRTFLSAYEQLYRDTVSERAHPTEQEPPP